MVGAVPKRDHGVEAVVASRQLHEHQDAVAGCRVGASAAAAARPLANTDGTADPAKTGIRPCLMKSRRLNMVAHLHQFTWNSGVASTMNSRLAWFWGCAALNACNPSLVVGLRLPSTRVLVSWSRVELEDDRRIRCVAPLTKLSRVSSVELLIQEVPAGQPATVGG